MNENSKEQSVERHFPCSIFDKLKGGKMKKLKYVLSLLMISCLLCGSMVHAAEGEMSTGKTLLYERMKKACLAGNQMDDWVAAERKQIAEEMGLSEYLDERSFLSIDYRNEHKIGRDGTITDPGLDLLVEMATQEEEEAILSGRLMRTFATARLVSSGQTVNVTQMPRVNGAGNGYFTVDGADGYGYCAQNKHDYWSNRVTKSGTAYEWNDGIVRKALYYGPGGPGYAGPYYGSLGADMDYVTFTIGYQNGESNNNTKARSYISFLSGKTDPLVWGYRAYKVDLVEPYQDVAFLGSSPSGNLDIIKYSSNPELTNDCESYSLAGAVYGIYAEDGDYSAPEYTVTLREYSDGWAPAGLEEGVKYGWGSITGIPVGNYWVKEITAPPGFELDPNWYPSAATPIAVKQDATSYVYAYDQPQTGSLEIIKYSADSDLTNENACYSLAGAVYGIYAADGDYSSPEYTVTLEEWKDGWVTAGLPEGVKYGWGRITGIPIGNYWVRELTPPKGFARDENWYPSASTPVYAAGGATVTVRTEDKPQFDPVKVLLEKRSKEADSPPLKGAWYEIRYYDVLLENETVNPAASGYEPLRKWVFETDEDGICYLSEEALVDGDEIYKDSDGTPLLPIGTITIQEIRAPEGYLIDEEVYVRQIIPEGDEKWVHSYQHPVILEETLDLNVIKLQTGTEIGVPGAVFEHTMPNGQKEMLTTDENGKIKFRALHYGEHELRELSAPAGYVVNENRIKFTVAVDNSVTFTSKNDVSVELEVSDTGSVEMTIYENPSPFRFVIHKQNNEGKALEGAEFTLYADAACTKIVQAGVTGSDGKLEFENLTSGIKYYLRETKAPLGYRIPVDSGGNPVVTEIYAFRIPAQDLFEFYVNGSKCDDSSKEGVSLTGTKEEPEAHIAIENEIGSRLPETGSSTTLILMLAGMVLFALGTLNTNRKRKEIKMKKSIFKNLLAVSLAILVTVAGITANAETKVVENGIVDFHRGDARITIVGNENQPLTGKKFHVYRLFDAENSKGLESINYTFNPDFKTALQTIVGERIEKEASKVTEYEVIDYIQSLNHNEVDGAHTVQTKEGSYSDFRYFMEVLRNEIVRQEVEGDIVTVTSTNAYNSFIISGLTYGYYIVDEITDVSGTHQAASLCMVNTANPNASITVKSDYPTVIEKIQEDDNKAAVGNEGWNDIADYEIGQDVPFRFESKIPNMNGYAGYYWAWHDNMDEALTLQNETIQIVLSGTVADIQKQYTLSETEFRLITDSVDNTFQIEIEDIKEIVDREFPNQNENHENSYGQSLMVTYKATLNEKAAKDLGRPGFENDVRVEFSNNPNKGFEDQTGFTPWDTVVCYTYQLNGLKINNYGTSLEGAIFRLYRDEACEREVSVKKTAEGYQMIHEDLAKIAPAEENQGIISDAKGEFKVYGLDGGTYYLKEVSAPTGYRPLLDPIKVQVEPVFAEERNSYMKGEGAGDAILKLAAKAKIKIFTSGAYTEREALLDVNQEEGSMNLSIVNEVGRKLPITGSQMMLIFAVAGVVLMVVAARRSTKKHE